MQDSEDPNTSGKETEKKPTLKMGADPSNNSQGTFERNLKWIALVMLLLQNSGLVLTMRYSRIAHPPDQTYIATTAVLSGEFLKLITSSLISFVVDCGCDIRRFRDLMRVEFVDNRKDFLKLFVPSGLYVIQNNLQFIATSNLPAEIFQVLTNMKIVTTAIFSVTMLGKEQTRVQWGSILALTAGIAVVQLSQTKGGNIHDNQNKMLGLICVITSACTSGFAGVYFEKVLKSTTSSIWVRNIQLAIIGIGFSSVACIASDYDKIEAQGFFFGYDKIVAAVITLSALGGLVVAVVVKYADNVLKGFAASASIVLSCFVSNLIFQEGTINTMFVVGATIVCLSAYVYSMKFPSDSSVSGNGSADKLSTAGQMKEEEKEGLLESEMTNNLTPRTSRDKL